MRARCHRMVLAVSLALGGVVVPGVSAAAEPGVHDGFYLRFGAGVGYLHDRGTVEERHGIRVEGTLTDVTPIGQLAVGGAISPGFFLGGALFGQYLPTPTAEGAEASLDEQTATIDVRFDPSALFLIGPFVDYYFVPESGLHLLGSVGLAYGILGGATATLLGFSESIDAESGGGIGGLGAVGYDLWIGDEWSLGLMGQLGLAHIGASDDRGNRSYHTILTPTLLATIAMN